MNTAKCPPVMVTNALCGASTPSTKALARLVGVVKSSEPWMTKTGTRESARERGRRECTRLRHQPFGAQSLPIDPVVHVAHRVPGCGQREPQHARDESVRPFEQVRPSPLHLIAAAILVGRRADLFEFAKGARVAAAARAFASSASNAT